MKTTHTPSPLSDALHPRVRDYFRLRSCGSALIWLYAVGTPAGRLQVVGGKDQLEQRRLENRPGYRGPQDRITKVQPGSLLIYTNGKIFADFRASELGVEK